MDLKLALQMSPNMELTTASYDTYIAAVIAVKSLKVKRNKCNNCLLTTTG